MAKQHLLLLAITLVAFVASSSAATSTSPVNSTVVDVARTVYNVLQKNNLSRGLFPKGVRSYTLITEGKLDVTLPDDCDFPFTYNGAVYTVRFGDRFGGLIKRGSIQQIHGVRVQISFWWLGISEINRFGDQIMISIQQNKLLPFPVGSFTVSPSCS